ncbi:Protein NEDD1 [Galemys pyrenaicus]|uniref:Protein NEDD1 n=1 Tax=Galemys pyrenaicus TaxID=202257 RepID=A0A8J6DEE6_GALPY|nr:Protein NEDD1 [Galemys pyrenaicus]
MKIWDSSVTLMDKFYPRASSHGINSMCGNSKNHVMTASTSGDKIVCSSCKCKTVLLERGEGQTQASISLNSTSVYVAGRGPNNTVNTWDLKSKRVQSLSGEIILQSVTTNLFGTPFGQGSKLVKTSVANAPLDFMSDGALSIGIQVKSTAAHKPTTNVSTTSHNNKCGEKNCTVIEKARSSSNKKLILSKKRDSVKKKKSRTSPPLIILEKNMIWDMLDHFRETCHGDPVILQVERVKQFHIRMNKMCSLLESYSVNEGLVAEIERLRIKDYKPFF